MKTEGRDQHYWDIVCSHKAFISDNFGSLVIKWNWVINKIPHKRRQTISQMAEDPATSAETPVDIVRYKQASPHGNDSKHFPTILEPPTTTLDILSLKSTLKRGSLKRLSVSDTPWKPSKENIQGVGIYLV